jgi:CTP:molybdopterin cytidylyltransferase MocA
VRIGAVVLAAGAGRRFGADAPKQLAVVRGRPVVERAAVAVAALEPRVVVLGARAAEVRAGADLAGAAVVVCEAWADGMAASLRCGLAALGDLDAVLVVLADQPFVGADVVAAVVARARAGAGRDAVRATYGGVPGHPVLLRRPLLSRVSEIGGDAGFRDLLAGADVAGVEAGHLGDPMDIDTREQLEMVT